MIVTYQLFIYKLLNNLLNEIKLKERKNNIVIILDNVYDNNYLSIDILNNIIKLIQSKSPYVKLILTGNGNFFNRKLIDLYIIKDPNELLTQDFLLFSIDKSELKEKINESIDFLEYSIKFKHLYEENKNKKGLENIIENIIEIEKKYICNYSFYGLFFGEELNKRNVLINDIKKDKNFLCETPLDLFEITLLKNENFEDCVYFLFYNKIYEKTIREIIGFQVENNTLSKLLKNGSFPCTFFGICFEKK